MLQGDRVTHFLVTALSTCSWDSRSSFMPTYTSLSNLSAEKKRKGTVKKRPRNTWHWCSAPCTEN